MTPVQSCGWGRWTPRWRVSYKVSAVHSNGAETSGSAVHSLNHGKPPKGRQADSENTKSLYLLLWQRPTTSFFIHLGLYTVTQAVNTLHVAHFVYAWKPQHDHLPADVIIDQLSHKVSSTSPTQLGLRVMSRCNIKNMNTKCIIDDILLVVLDMP